MSIRVSSLAEAEHLMQSFTVRLDELEKTVRDHAERFETLQTPLWKRLWFRVDGWPGQRDLNAEKRTWRPWH